MHVRFASVLYEPAGQSAKKKIYPLNNRTLDSKTRTARRTQFSQYSEVRSRGPASVILAVNSDSRRRSNVTFSERSYGNKFSYVRHYQKSESFRSRDTA